MVNYNKKLVYALDILENSGFMYQSENFYGQYFNNMSNEDTNHDIIYNPMTDKILFVTKGISIGNVRIHSKMDGEIYLGVLLSKLRTKKIIKIKQNGKD